MNIHIVLVNPQIPQNTGSIGRMCVCLDASLHLVRPLGFELDETHLRRAGLDYWPYLDLAVHDTWETFLRDARPPRLFFASTRGSRLYYDFAFREGDFLVFGSETSGLPPALYERHRNQLYTIPMPGRHMRSHNLATSVGIVTYEAYRQIHHAEAAVDAAAFSGGGAPS